MNYDQFDCCARPGSVSPPQAFSPIICQCVARQLASRYSAKPQRLVE